MLRDACYSCVAASIVQTNERKEQMCLLVREALTVGKIGFHPDFVSTELEPEKAKRQLLDELTSYCVMVEPPKTTFGKVRKTLGKVHRAVANTLLQLTFPNILRRQAGRLASPCNWRASATRSSSGTRGTSLSGGYAEHAGERAAADRPRRAVRPAGGGPRGLDRPDARRVQLTAASVVGAVGPSGSAPS